MSSDPSLDLRRYLLQAPARSNFLFTEDTRREIRQAIFLSISNQGRYLDWLFPKASDPHKPPPSSDFFIQKADKEYDWLFSKYHQHNDQSKDPRYDTHKYHAFRSNSPCARIFRKGEPIYRCLTCGFDDTCALCSHCYHPEYHVGHKVHITICQRENGGVCDCGDPEAWVNEFFCPYASDDDSLNIKNRPMPEDFIRSFSSTLETLLDYVIDVMSVCDLHYYSPWDDSTHPVEKYSASCTLDPEKYGFRGADPSILDPNSEKYCLMYYNDQIRHFRDSVQRIHLASKKVPQFAVMVTEKAQSYGKAKVISSSNISLLQNRQKILSSTGLASCIRSHRDVFREDMCDEIILFIKDLTESEMFKINNRAKNLFCKAFCCKWDKGLFTKRRLNGNSAYSQGKLDSNFNIPKVPSVYSEHKEKSHWNFVPSKWNLPVSICEECNYNLTEDDFNLHQSHAGSRFQYFVYLDIRFWKSIRSVLHDMYSTSLITNLSFKNIICCQYVDIYPTIADMFLTTDREPELNIMSVLSTQLFTCPSNSTSIIQHGDVSRIFASIYGYLSTGKIESPDTISLSHELSMNSLKNRRWGQIFFDIGYILSRSRDSKTILSNNIIPMACDILALFQGRPVMRRESKNHVEYESPDYTAFFHAILVIYKFGEHIASCLTALTEVELQFKNELAANAIEYVLKFLLRFEYNEYPKLSDESVDVDLSPNREVVIEPIGYKAIRRFNIGNGKVSFLHPIHSFLSWLIELSDFKAIEDLQLVLRTNKHPYLPEEVLLKYPYLTNSATINCTNIDNLTSIIEYPIRTIVLLSQIKSGFWVRNGFSVRTQLQLYRNTGLRESGYLRDLFLIQVFVNCNDPNLVCFLLLKRWLLLDSWNVTSIDQISSMNSAQYDKSTLPYMLEECLNFFIHLLTEDLYLRGLPDDVINQTRIKNEIIHTLCFGPMNYSKLCSHIPDHITTEKIFDIILEDMTVFSCPTGSKDIGIYRLKEEYFDQINPYYFNYTTNAKDDAIKFVKEQIQKKTHKVASEIVISPKVRLISELGIYKFVGNFSASVYFKDFLIKTLRHIHEEGVGKADSLLETTLHLIHTCSLESSVDIKTYGTFYDQFVTISSSQNTSVAVLLYRTLINDTYKDHHSKIRSIFKEFEEKYHNINDYLSQAVDVFDPLKLEFDESEESAESEFERKKRIAKERQVKLMAKFKKQQSLFSKKNNFDQIESSDMEMEDFEEDSGWKFPTPHCILCQNASEESGPFGIIAHISKSSEFRNVPFDDDYWFMKSFSDESSLDKGEEDTNNEHHTNAWKNYMNKIKEFNVIGPGFKNSNEVDNKLVSLTCGHGMHFQCYINFVSSHRSRLNQITRNSPENVEHKEFLCPLCKAINNMFVPILWSTNKKSLSKFLVLVPGDNFENLKTLNFQQDSWLKNFTQLARKDIEQENILSPSAAEMIGSSSTNMASINQQHFRILLSNMFQILSLLTFPHIFKADSVQVLSNSIKSTEISLRGVTSHGELVINQLSNNSLTNLRTWNEFRNTSLLMKINNWIQAWNVKPDAHVKLLASLLCFSGEEFNTAIMERDFFESLVTIFPLPSLEFLFNSILRNCFIGHIIQSLHILALELPKREYYKHRDYDIFDIPYSTEVSSQQAELMTIVYKKLRSSMSDYSPSEETVINDPKFGYIIYSMLLKCCTPFLRRSAIYAFVCCANIDDIDLSLYKRIELEAERLCRFLNLNSLEQILTSFISSEKSIEHARWNSFLTYLANHSLKTNSTDVGLKKNLEYPGIVKLIDLPDRLDYFFTEYYYSDRYSNPNMTIENPAVCLFCSEVVDVQKAAIGCKEGQCTTHYLKECSNSVGIFLLPKERSLLLLHKNGGSFYNAPYLDQHGELPAEAKKGKTLYLLKARYDDFIREVWLQHNVSNFVVRKLDSVMDAGGWDTL